MVQKMISENPGDVVEQLAAVCREIMRLSIVARKEGLLSLLDAVTDKNMPEILLKEEFVRIIQLVVDGTDPELVADISMKRYFAKNYRGLEGLAFLTLVDGALDIQAMVNPGPLEESIRSFMPDEVNEALDRIRDEEEKKEQEECHDSWEKLYKKSSCCTYPDYSYIVIPLNYCIRNMRDEDAKTLMARTDDLDLSLLIKVLDGNACRKIHDSIPEERAQVIIRDRDYMGPSRSRDVEKSADAVFQDILKLGKADIIHVPASLDKVFEIRDDSKKYRNNRSEKFMRLFMGMSNRCVQRVLEEIPEETLSYAMKGWDRDLRRHCSGDGKPQG